MMEVAGLILHDTQNMLGLGGLISWSLSFWG